MLHHCHTVVYMPAGATLVWQGSLFSICKGYLIQILEDPFFLSAVLAALLPLVAAGILTGCIGGTIGDRAAGSSIGLAFIIAYLSILGWPPLLPRSSLHKIVYLALIGLLLGVVLDFLIDRVPIRAVAADLARCSSCLARGPAVARP